MTDCAVPLCSAEWIRWVEIGGHYVGPWRVAYEPSHLWKPRPGGPAA